MAGASGRVSTKLYQRLLVPSGRACVAPWPVRGQLAWVVPVAPGTYQFRPGMPISPIEQETKSSCQTSRRRPRMAMCTPPCMSLSLSGEWTRLPSTSHISLLQSLHVHRRLAASSYLQSTSLWARCTHRCRPPLPSLAWRGGVGIQPTCVRAISSWQVLSPCNLFHTKSTSQTTTYLMRTCFVSYTINSL